MKSGETAGHGNGLPLALTARQAKRAGPDLEAGPEAPAERSEGTMEARQGRDAAGGSMRYARQRDRPCFLAGDAHAINYGQHGLDAQDEMPLVCRGCRAGAAGAAVSRGAKRSAAGMAARPSPGVQAKRAAPQARRYRHRARQKKRRVAPKDNAPEGRRAISARSSPATAQSRPVQRTRMAACPRSGR